MDLTEQIRVALKPEYVDRDAHFLRTILGSAVDDRKFLEAITRVLHEMNVTFDEGIACLLLNAVDCDDSPACDLPEEELVKLKSIIIRTLKERGGGIISTLISALAQRVASVGCADWPQLLLALHELISSGEEAKLGIAAETIRALAVGSAAHVLQPHVSRILSTIMPLLADKEGSTAQHVLYIFAALTHASASGEEFKPYYDQVIAALELMCIDDSVDSLEFVDVLLQEAGGPKRKAVVLELLLRGIPVITEALGENLMLAGYAWDMIISAAALDIFTPLKKDEAGLEIVLEGVLALIAHIFKNEDEIEPLKAEGCELTDLFQDDLVHKSSELQNTLSYIARKLSWKLYWKLAYKLFLKSMQSKDWRRRAAGAVFVGTAFAADGDPFTGAPLKYIEPLCAASRDACFAVQASSVAAITLWGDQAQQHERTEIPSIGKCVTAAIDVLEFALEGAPMLSCMAVGIVPTLTDSFDHAYRSRLANDAFMDVLVKSVLRPGLSPKVLASMVTVFGTALEYYPHAETVIPKCIPVLRSAFYSIPDLALRLRLLESTTCLYQGGEDSPCHRDLFALAEEMIKVLAPLVGGPFAALDGEMTSCFLTGILILLEQENFGNASLLDIFFTTIHNLLGMKGELRVIKPGEHDDDWDEERFHRVDLEDGTVMKIDVNRVNCTRMALQRTCELQGRLLSTKNMEAECAPEFIAAMRANTRPLMDVCTDLWEHGISGTVKLGAFVVCGNAILTEVPHDRSQAMMDLWFSQLPKIMTMDALGDTLEVHEDACEVIVRFISMSTATRKFGPKHLEYICETTANACRGFFEYATDDADDAGEDDDTEKEEDGYARAVDALLSVVDDACVSLKGDACVSVQDHVAKPILRMLEEAAELQVPNRMISTMFAVLSEMSLGYQPVPGLADTLEEAKMYALKILRKNKWTMGTQGAAFFIGTLAQTAGGSLIADDFTSIVHILHKMSKNQKFKREAYIAAHANVLAALIKITSSDVAATDKASATEAIMFALSHLPMRSDNEEQQTVNQLLFKGLEAPGLWWSNDKDVVSAALKALLRVAAAEKSARTASGDDVDVDDDSDAAMSDGEDDEGDADREHAHCGGHDHDHDHNHGHCDDMAHDCGSSCGSECSESRIPLISQSQIETLAALLSSPALPSPVPSSPDLSSPGLSSPLRPIPLLSPPLLASALSGCSESQRTQLLALLESSLDSETFGNLRAIYLGK